MSGPTPGPYGFNPTTGEIYYDDGDVRPVIALVIADNTSDAQFLADGVLFAAAPETAAECDRLRAVNGQLVEALEYTRHHYREHLIDAGFTEPMLEGMTAKATAALATARKLTEEPS